MNKFLRFFLTAFMAIVTLSVSSQTVVIFDASADKGTRTTADPGEDQITKDGVTITISNGCMNLDNQYRCYSGADFTVTSTVEKILKVEITCTAKGEAKYGPGSLTNPSAGTYDFENDNQVGTWTGNTASFTLTATKQVRITQVVVTLGDAPASPTFSLPEGIYMEPQSVSLNSETGSFIIYTLNGEEPAYTDDAHFTGIKYDGNPLTISETTTINAIAVNDKGKASYVATAIYTIVSIQGEVTFDGSADKGSRTAADPGEDQIAKDDITISVSNGCMNLDNQYRCYSGADFTVTSTGNNIVKVEITCTANGEEKYGPGCFTNPSAGTYTFEAESQVGTWIGNAASFTMNATKQVRISKIVVTFSDTPVEPTFSIEPGMYFGEQKVTMIGGTNNFIIYTLNGEEPAYTDENHFTGIKYDGNPLTISETTTIMAIAVTNKGKTSNISTATYSIMKTEGNGTIEKPFSVADALLVIKDYGPTPMFYTKGIVVGDVTIDDGDATFRIGATADATTDLISVYKTRGLENTECEVGDVKPGDEVVIYANLQDFNGTPETWRGYIYSINGKTSKPTGIQTVNSDKQENATIYSLQGVRINHTQKGLYIVNGKKVVMK